MSNSTGRAVIRLYPLQVDVRVEASLVNTSCQQELAVLVQCVQRLVERGAHLHVTFFFWRQVIKVFVDRRAWIDLVLTSSRHHHGGEGVVRVSIRVWKRTDTTCLRARNVRDPMEVERLRAEYASRLPEAWNQTLVLLLPG